MKNLNDMAKIITLEEGKKVSLTIAQVKEVLKIVCRIMREDPDAIILMLESAKTKRVRRA